MLNKLVTSFPKLRLAKIEEFKLDARNARKHRERGKKLLSASLKARKFFRPVAAVADSTIMAGNSTMAEAANIGMKEAIVIESDGTRPIVHVRTDIKNAQSKIARRLALEDNRVAELSLEWDAEILAAELSDEGMLQDLFDDRELGKLGVEIAKQVSAENSSIDLDDRFLIIIECVNEREQKKLLDRFEKEGLACKALIS